MIQPIEPTSVEKKVVKLESETLTHYEPTTGIHVLVKREQRGIPTTERRHTIVYLGNLGEKETLVQHGEKSHGLRHFFEHLAAQALASLDGAVRLLRVNQHELRLAGIEIHASTSLQSMQFRLSTPHDTDFAKHMAFIAKIVAGDMLPQESDLIQFSKQERRRILSEIDMRQGQREVERFIWEEIYTPDSFARIPPSLGTPSSVKAATTEQIKDIMDDVTKKPVVIVIDNPPTEYSDEMIIHEISECLTERQPLIPEANQQSNTLNEPPNTWKHLEHYRMSAKTCKATLHIPVAEDMHSDKSIIIASMFNDMLDGDLSSPLAQVLEYGEMLGLYSENLVFDEPLNALQLVADVDVSDLALFVNQASEFLMTPGAEDYIRAAFESFKVRRMDEILARHLNPDWAAGEIIHSGKFASIEQQLDTIRSIELDDLLHFLAQVRSGLENISLLTQTGITTTETRQMLREQASMMQIPINQRLISVKDGPNTDTVRASFSPK